MSLLGTFLVILAVLLALFGLVSLGFVIWPRPFRPHPAPSQPGEPAAFRPDLPEPVRRHFLDTLGESPQIIHSAVVWGRGKIHIRGVWAPMRFKAWYLPGEAYYRRMEVTWFRRPILRGTDRYMHGRGQVELGGRVEEDERVTQRQLLSLWAETVWMPSVFVHDARIEWNPVDEQTARLDFPTPGGKDSLLAHFDAETGRMTHFSGRCFDGGGEEKEPWRMDLLFWKRFHGLQIPGEIAVAWGESGSPWSYWSVDGVAYNVNVTDQMSERAAG